MSIINGKTTHNAGSPRETANPEKKLGAARILVRRREHGRGLVNIQPEHIKLNFFVLGRRGGGKGGGGDQARIWRGEWHGLIRRRRLASLGMRQTRQWVNEALVVGKEAKKAAREH